MNKYLKTKEPLRTVEAFTMPIVSKSCRKERKNFKKIFKDDLCYIYNDGVIRFEFSMLSDYVKDDLSVQELQSYNRYNNSCYKNLSVTKIFDDSSIMVGFVVVGEETFLHSWVEFNSDNGKKVVDYTRNIIMDKDLYYSFMTAEAILEFDSDNYPNYLEVFEKSEELDNTVCFPIHEDKVDDIRSKLILSRDK